MTTLEVILLSIIQGITEFLPVSSSGHLTLAQQLFGIHQPSEYILLALVLHLGTLTATVAYLFPVLWNILWRDQKKIFQLALATLPLLGIVPLLHWVESFFDRPEYLGFFFLITAVLLLSAARVQRQAPTQHPWRDFLLIGLAQAMAILPGISRSGTTIATARFLGWPCKEAVVTSFLLAIPAVLGGLVLESVKLVSQGGDVLSGIPLSTYLIGFALSALIGWFALQLVIRLIEAGRIALFGWYCTILGIFCIVYFNLL